MVVLNSALASTNKLLRRIDFVHTLSKNLRRVVATGEEISELSRLIEQNRMVVLKPFSQMKINETGRKTVHETVKDYLETYRTVAVRKFKVARLAVPQGAVLLRYPLALLTIPSAHEEYLKAAGEDTRRKIRKAAIEGYHFREFDWNDNLDAIFKINTSKEIRSAGAMHGWYTEQVKPRHHSEEDRHYRKYYGVFKDDQLFAYLHLILCGDFAYFKHILGHADHLKYGIMYYLVSCTVREYTSHSQVKWLSYGIFPAGSTGGTIDFRKHARFEGYSAFLDLEDDEALQTYSRRVRARGLTSV